MRRKRPRSASATGAHRPPKNPGAGAKARGGAVAAPVDVVQPLAARIEVAVLGHGASSRSVPALVFERPSDGLQVVGHLPAQSRTPGRAVWKIIQSVNWSVQRGADCPRRAQGLLAPPTLAMYHSPRQQKEAPWFSPWK